MAFSRMLRATCSAAMLISASTCANSASSASVLNTVLRIFGHVRITDATSGFRAASKGVIAFFAQNYAQDYPEPESIIAVNANGFRVKEVPVVMNERTAGVSSISPWKSVYYMIKVSFAILVARFSR